MKPMRKSRRSVAGLTSNWSASPTCWKSAKNTSFPWKCVFQFSDRKAEWLIDWLNDRSIDWVIEWLIDWSVTNWFFFVTLNSHRKGAISRQSATPAVQRESRKASSSLIGMSRPRSAPRWHKSRRKLEHDRRTLCCPSSPWATCWWVCPFSLTFSVWFLANYRPVLVSKATLCSFL